MPSPLAHLTMGYVLHQLTAASAPQSPRPRGGVRARLGRLGQLAPRLFLLLGFSMLPDVDAVAGLLAGDLATFHNQWTHSLFVGLVAALLVALAFGGRRGPFPWANWGLLTLAYGLHSLMDAATVHGRGVMLFWPFSTTRFHAGLSLFSGVQWGDGLWTSAHVWTLVTEALFAGVILLLAQGWLAWRRAVVVRRLDGEEA